MDNSLSCRVLIGKKYKMDLLGNIIGFLVAGAIIYGVFLVSVIIFSGILMFS